MRTSEIIDLIERATDKLDDIKEYSARSGKNIQKLGKWLVPQTKHYSWLKVADIIGIGTDRVVSVPVDSSYRMDIAELENIIRSLVNEGTPILGVVGVVGSTEEGAVDNIDKIVELREKLVSEGIYYYIHVDLHARLWNGQDADNNFNRIFGEGSCRFNNGNYLCS